MSTIQRHSWLVKRHCTISREVNHGEIEYVVRVWDVGRKKPFIENAFTTERQATEFYERIRSTADSELSSTPEP